MPPNHANSARRLLVADDEPTVRDVVRLTLQGAGYECEVVEDGERLLSRFFEAPERYAGILLDVTMPNISGVEVARRIRAAQFSVPIVLMSGYANDDASHEALGAGFVQKPFRTSTLLEAVERALS